MSKIFQIQINFPVGVDWPSGFEQTLDALVNMICEKYEDEYPTRKMWTSGHGAKLLWREPLEPDSDDSIYCIDISEREATERELQRRDRG